MDQNGNYNQPYQNNGQQPYNDNYNGGNYGGSNYNNNYNNYNSGNYNNYNYNGNMQWQKPAPQYAPVRDIFCNFLLVIFILQIVLAVFTVHSMFSAITYESMMNGSYVYDMYTGAYMACSMISLILSICMIVFFVLDIVGISKAGHKILGLILFAIFFRPGYYIWRAHVLDRKKTFPIIYTIIYGVVLVAYIAFVIVEVMQMVSSMFTMY